MKWALVEFSYRPQNQEKQVGIFAKIGGKGGGVQESKEKCSYKGLKKGSQKSGKQVNIFANERGFKLSLKGRTSEIRKKLANIFAKENGVG